MAPVEAQGDTVLDEALTCPAPPVPLALTCPGKYIYCPSRVFSLYNAQGMEKEMTWPDFQQSDFYDAERDRWIADKRKP
ncbi:hypothetical protein KUCAC02_036312 [Chaenocephalus aceratus]|nr:hypothetical protein KUCAC02_036312 [Chaenocephalus aceratus]